MPPPAPGDSNVNASAKSPASGRPNRARRIRYTLDLSREQHRFLKLFALDANVDASVVLRTVLELLQEDQVLTRKVLRRLEAMPGRRH